MVLVAGLVFMWSRYQASETVESWRNRRSWRRGSLREEEQLRSLEEEGEDSHLGWRLGSEDRARGQALTFPAGSPSVWLSAMKLEPLGDARMQLLDGRQDRGRGAAILRVTSELGGSQRGRLGSRPRNLEVG